MAGINVCAFIKGDIASGYINAYEPVIRILYCGLHGACRIMIWLTCHTKLFQPDSNLAVKSGSPSYFWCHSQSRVTNFES